MSFLASLDVPDAMTAALEVAYTIPARAYHDLTHIRQVWQRYEEVAKGPGWSQPCETLLAVLYHDAVYVPGRSDNETCSAALAYAHITRWLPNAKIDAMRVSELITLTARHGNFTPTDFGVTQEAADTRHFLDCDMSILGAPAQVFDRYNRAIAEEYRNVLAPGEFQRRRQAFLRALLARERIFLSDYFHARLDARARVNIARAIRQ